MSRSDLVLLVSSLGLIGMLVLALLVDGCSVHAEPAYPVAPVYLAPRPLVVVHRHRPDWIEPRWHELPPPARAHHPARPAARHGAPARQGPRHEPARPR
jgi:hypothetical protein